MSAQPNYDNASTPKAGQGIAMPLFHTSGAELTLAASGDWTRSDIISVMDAREIVLLIAYDPSTSSGGYPHIVPLVSCNQAQPAAGDDSWYMPGVTDGTVTEVSADTGLPSGADYTAVPGYGEVLYRPIMLRCDAADNASDEIRLAIRLNVAPYRWLHLICAEKGLTANPGALLITYTLTSG